MVADDGLGRWSAVELPTLLLQGADTWAPMPATMDRLAAVLPRIERLVWPAQMHFAASTAPDLVAGALSRFLAAQEAAWE